MAIVQNEKRRKRPLKNFLAGIAIPVIFLCAMMGAVSASADDFTTVWSFGSVDDETRVELQPDIKINFLKDETEEQKTRKLCRIIIERELEDPDFESGVCFKLESIEYKSDCWYLKYSWAYESDYNETKRLDRLLYLKIDFKNKHIVHSRPLDDQFMGNS